MPASLVTLPATTPLAEILEVIRRDGGLIIKDFLAPEQVKSLNDAAAPIFDELKQNPEQMDLDELGEEFYASKTTHIRRMAGRLPKETIMIMDQPLWEQIMAATLKFKVRSWVGDTLHTTESGYILNNAAAYKVEPGSEGQVLHRDQHGHLGVTEEQGGTLYTTVMGCLVAGARSTKRNGATRVIPGSHLWGYERRPTQEEAVSAEMEAGSALFWMGSVYHGAGANTCAPGESDSVRILYGVFGCPDYMRSEECILLQMDPKDLVGLPRETLRKLGFAKSTGGANAFGQGHPMDGWKYMPWGKAMA
ncbi:hypothetical protein MNV49_001744 [Pseudohyphozyma bogoriensis]|nr:hypothetical protein MNV49_001744 [Pseudohyphozyma bogoriensis]